MKGICLTFYLVPRLVVYDKYQLRYDWICMYTPTCKNCIKGYHGNHFARPKCVYFFRNIVFSFLGSHETIWHPSKIVMGVQGRSN